MQRTFGPQSMFLSLIIKLSRDIIFDKRSRGFDIGDYKAAVM